MSTGTRGRSFWRFIGGGVLVVALLAAPAYASHLVVRTSDLVDGAVTTPKLAVNAVSTNRLRAGAVTTSRLRDGAVKSSKVADGSLTGDDIDESTLANVDATTIGGVGLGDLVRRGPSGAASTSSLRFFSYFMNTGQSADYPFTQAKIQTNGTPGQFKVCGNNPGVIATLNFVAYVNGVRNVGTVSANGGCSTTFDAGAGGDFQVSIRRVQIFGVHSGDGTANENYQLIGWSSL